jgi:hypothetical protein
LVGFATTNFTPGAGADIVMESITLKTPADGRTDGASLKCPVGVEKLDLSKLAKNTLHLGSPTNDFLPLGRHFLSPKFL